MDRTRRMFVNLTYCMADSMQKKTEFKLKDIYSPELLADFAKVLRKVRPDFSATTFQDQVFDRKWQGLELKERMRHISDCLHRLLPDDFATATSILVDTTEHFIQEQGEKMAFEYGFLPDFVERFGLEQPEVSVPALERMTRWTSAEFAVRPYLRDYPERMYTQMQEWARHESPFVRRLASEGFRPRLPWGMGIPVLKRRPELILPVLEQLKVDPAETVRRSVANNLNDISKDHPERVLDIAGRWLGDNPNTDWIVRHACRGLLKKGHPTALKLFGFDPDLETITIHGFQCDASVRIGERFHFSFSLLNQGSQSVMIRLEYAIDYQTLSGKISRKVFKISEFEIAAGEERLFSKDQRFEDFTTRKHYPGSHRLGILMNGREMAKGEFEVVK